MAILEGTAYWVSATTPNTKFEPCYTVNLVVDEETAASFKSRGFSIKQMDEGPSLTIKRKVNGPAGMVRPAPKLMDKNKTPMDVSVGNGSTVKVQYKEWESNYNGTVYRGLDFQAMQVINLIEHGVPDGAEFESLDDEEMEDEL